MFVYGLAATEGSLGDKEDFAYRMGPGTEQIFARTKAKWGRSLGGRVDCVSKESRGEGD